MKKIMIMPVYWMSSFDWAKCKTVRYCIRTTRRLTKQMKTLNWASINEPLVLKKAKQEKKTLWLLAGVATTLSFVSLSSTSNISFPCLTPSRPLFSLPSSHDPLSLSGNSFSSSSPRFLLCLSPCSPFRTLSLFLSFLSFFYFFYIMKFLLRSPISTFFSLLCIPHCLSLSSSFHLRLLSTPTTITTSSNIPYSIHYRPASNWSEKETGYIPCKSFTTVCHQKGPMHAWCELGSVSRWLSSRRALISPNLLKQEDVIDESRWRRGVWEPKC